MNSKNKRNNLKKSKSTILSNFTLEQELQALNNSPVKIIGGIKNGKPTTVEQKSISIYTRNEDVKNTF